MQKQQAIYLNNAGTSWPKPKVVLEAANSVLQQSPEDWPSLFEVARQDVAGFFHVAGSRLLLTPSCTAALNIAVMDQVWSAGDRVVTSHFEHHALHRALVKLNEVGVAVATLPRGNNELIELDALESELRAGNVRLVALTAACNVTGRLLPIVEAIDLAHTFGARVLIDGAQVAGWWDLNVADLQADMFAFAGHKGTQAPWGIGGLYVAPDVAMNCPVAHCDVPASQAEGPCSLMPGYCDVGSVNLPALAGLAAGCRWLSQRDRKTRLHEARTLAGAFADGLRPIAGVKIHDDVPAERKMPTVAITVGNESSNDVAARLREVGLIASVGYQCAPRAHQALNTQDRGVVRFSFGPSSHASEMSRAIEMVKRAFDR